MADTLVVVRVASLRPLFTAHRGLRLTPTDEAVGAFTMSTQRAGSAVDPVTRPVAIAMSAVAALIW